MDFLLWLSMYMDKEIDQHLSLFCLRNSLDKCLRLALVNS